MPKTTLSSAELRDIISALAFNDTEAATRLVVAQQALRSATRQAVITGDTQPRDDAQAELEAAKAHRSEAASMWAEGIRLHDEAVVREQDEAKETARDQLRALSAEMLTAARAADAALATYAGHINEARRLETESAKLSQSVLGAGIAGSIVSDALSDGSRHLLALRSDSPDPISNYAEERARKSVRRISAAAGL